MMLPFQIRQAIDENWPVILPLGVLEYHGEHLAVGLDTLVVIKTVKILDAEIGLVQLPPFYYGAASYAVAPPERNGSLHVDADKLYPLAREIFRGLLRIGFRNFHFFVHHQSENFTAGMPTDLAFKLGACQARGTTLIIGGPFNSGILVGREMPNYQAETQFWCVRSEAKWQFAKCLILFILCGEGKGMTDNSGRLVGKTALITTAGQDIGRATAKNFADQGAQVFASDESSFMTGHVHVVDGGWAT